MYLHVYTCTFVWAAHALANNVFPVPGAPYNRTPDDNEYNNNNNYIAMVTIPLGGCIPMFSNLSLCVIGSTIASTSYRRYIDHVCAHCRVLSRNISLGGSSDEGKIH